MDEPCVEARERLCVLVLLRSETDGRMTEAVRECRSHGVTWEEIGALLGVRRQSAWQRYHGASG